MGDSKLRVSLFKKIHDWIPLTHHDLRDLGLICSLVQKRKIRSWILSDFTNLIFDFLNETHLKWQPCFGATHTYIAHLRVYPLPTNAHHLNPMASPPWGPILEKYRPQGWYDSIIGRRTGTFIISFPDLLWTKPKARSGKVRKFVFLDWQFSAANFLQTQVLAWKFPQLEKMKSW